VVIPAGIRNSTFHHRVNRGIRHQIRICCATLVGDACCPLLVSSNPEVRQVFDQGVPERIGIRIKITPSPDANTEIFNRYCDTVLIPVVVSNREIERYQNKHAI
jgi:hypothetical protein